MKLSILCNCIPNYSKLYKHHLGHLRRYIPCLIFGQSVLRLQHGEIATLAPFFKSKLKLRLKSNNAEANHSIFPPSSPSTVVALHYLLHSGSVYGKSLSTLKKQASDLSIALPSKCTVFLARN